MKKNPKIEKNTEPRAKADAVSLEQQGLIQSQKMAIVGQMAAGVAHEINTPLGTISLLAGELRQSLLDDRFERSDAIEMLKDIESAAMRISQITHGLRAVARDSSNDAYVFANLREIIDSMVHLCQNRFANNGVIITTKDLPENLEIECHPAQIGQILLNLLSNAFDAVKELREKWIHVEAVDHGETIALIVRDSGGGIPEKIREKVFQPFFTTKPTGAGTGLGLSIVRSLAEAHGGEIFLNENSKHTEFCFKIPKHQTI